uniref:Endonuclease/exonuclease/phosphatase domain-containing protein n=1 Tax=Trichogramma kaykai TaxID=54128 RepID=A0ABD2VVE0_9HYME
MSVVKNTSTLKILQWNCRSVSKKLILQNEANKYDIIILVETWLNETKRFKLKGFNIVRFNRTSGEAGGLAICVKDYLFFEKTAISFKSRKLETGSIIVKLNSENFLITACYRPPTIDNVTNNLTSLEWKKLCDALLNHSCKNFAHNPLWGSQKYCTNGKIIGEYLDFDDIILLNNGCPTHFNLSYSGFSESCIDLTFCSPGLFPKSNWYVLDDGWMSDHYPIILELNVNLLFHHRLKYRYNLKKLDWSKFYSNLDANKVYFNSMQFTNQNVISRYSIFIEYINNAITDALPNCNKPNNKPKISPNINASGERPRCIWWNDNCDRATILRKAAKKSIKFKYTLDRFIEVKKTEAAATKTLREEKQKSFQSFCNTINHRSKI